MSVRVLRYTGLDRAAIEVIPQAERSAEPGINVAVGESSPDRELLRPSWGAALCVPPSSLVAGTVGYRDAPRRDRRGRSYGRDSGHRASQYDHDHDHVHPHDSEALHDRCHLLPGSE